MNENITDEVTYLAYIKGQQNRIRLLTILLSLVSSFSGFLILIQHFQHFEQD